MHKLLTRPLAAAAALALAASPAVAQPGTDLDPALWVVKDADTTIYLFGTVHALKPGLDWFNDEIKMAFNASNALFVEVELPDDKAEMAAQVRKYGMLPPGQTLPSKLSKEGAKRLGDDLARLGLPRNTLDQYKPFFAAVSLTMLHLMKDGSTADDGVEKLLQATATADHKPIGSLETLEFQLTLFDALPEKEQVRMLEDGLKDNGFENDNLDEIVAAWGRGDAEGVAKIINENETDSPLLYQKLLVERNRNWTNWVQGRLSVPGVTFVAIGAAHLAGPDSVQNMLAKRGIRSSRVPHVE